MPLVRIDLMKGKPPEYRRALADGVYRALVEAVGAPENDQFVVVSEHGQDGLVYDPTYLGIERTDDVVFIQITLNEGRPVEKKKDLYKKIAELLIEKTGVRPEDLMINLVEVSKANWSYGHGEAQYVS
jgi:phenylpyruvate tautomerase PptA (4-oxalocrotonate tautomerase family)